MAAIALYTPPKELTKPECVAFIAWYWKRQGHTDLQQCERLQNKALYVLREQVRDIQGKLREEGVEDRMLSARSIHTHSDTPLPNAA